MFAPRLAGSKGSGDSRRGNSKSSQQSTDSKNALKATDNTSFVKFNTRNEQFIDTKSNLVMKCAHKDNFDRLFL